MLSANILNGYRDTPALASLVYKAPTRRLDGRQIYDLEWRAFGPSSVGVYDVIVVDGLRCRLRLQSSFMASARRISVPRCLAFQISPNSPSI